MKRGDQSPALEWIKPCREILQFAEIHVYRGANCQSENCHTNHNVNIDCPRSHFSSNKVRKREKRGLRERKQRKKLSFGDIEIFFLQFPKKMFTRLLIDRSFSLILCIIVSVSWVFSSFFCNICNKGLHLPISPAPWE